MIINGENRAYVRHLRIIAKVQGTYFTLRRVLQIELLDNKVARFHVGITEAAKVGLINDGMKNLDIEAFDGVAAVWVINSGEKLGNSFELQMERFYAERMKKEDPNFYEIEPHLTILED